MSRTVTSHPRGSRRNSELSQTRPASLITELQEEADNENENEEEKARKIEAIQEEMGQLFKNWITLTQRRPVREKIGLQNQKARKLFGQVAETLGMKRLFVCCDGTLQNAVGTMRPMSNVARLARSIYRIGGDAFDCGTLGGVPQLAYYSSGIGSNSIVGVDRLFAAATGKGFTGTVLNAYCFISNNYNGSSLRDEIILVGYSRGAFAMRCLAQFISDVGLLRRIGLPFLGMFWKLWLTGKTQEWEARSEEFSSIFFKDAEIKVLAEWDPVKSLVWPSFHGRKRLANITKIVPKRVRNAFVAISLHEKRWSYKPVLWEKQWKGQNVHQCAFLGSHSDIGGGNIDAGLSTISLFWMVAKIQEACGARFDRNVLTQFFMLQKVRTGHQITRLIGKRETSLVTQAFSEGNVNKSSYLWQFPRFICLGLCFNGNRSRLFKSIAKQENCLKEEPGEENTRGENTGESNAGEITVRARAGREDTGGNAGGENELCELSIHRTVKSITKESLGSKLPISLKGFDTSNDKPLKWASDQGKYFEEAKMGSEELFLLRAWVKAADKIQKLSENPGTGGLINVGVGDINDVMTQELQPREHNEDNGDVTRKFMDSNMWRITDTMVGSNALINCLRGDFQRLEQLEGPLAPILEEGDNPGDSI